MNKSAWVVLGSLVFASASAHADPKSVRWTGAEDKDAGFAHVLELIKAKTGYALTAADFLLLEDRDLAREHFKMFVQLAGSTPIRSMSIRVWTDRKSGETVQLEARVESPATAALLSGKVLSMNAARKTLSSQDTMSLVRAQVASSDDNRLQGVSWRDVLDHGTLVRVIKAKGRRGKHLMEISLESRKVTTYRYEEFPQAEYSVPAMLYPIYEETEATHHILPRVPMELKYLQTLAPRPTSDPYAAFTGKHFVETMFDPILGMTEAGRAKGYWSMTYIKQQAAEMLGAMQLSDNTFGNADGAILQGRYATVSIHPDALKNLGSGLDFTPARSGQFMGNWQPTSDNPDIWEMVPMATYLGRPLASAAEALARPARRLPNHDPASYLNDGFDELQVYYAVTQMFESLAAMGFTDPELSTRPFNAFLYNPDISMRDNAFYTDDTINFTTYSPDAINFARDNSTIWHELGHGVMDRLMGDEITLADTGGLSEGMADFVADLVIGDVTGGETFDGREDFRIVNRLSFFTSNEVHDDGEAYGGTMHDLLEAAMAAEGRAGLAKVTDLILETMRLTRNHPALTAPEWFTHMLFADDLGAEGLRAPGELRAIIMAALNGRNFSFDETTVAKLTVMNGSNEVTNRSAGSRNNPVKVPLAEDGKESFHLSVNVTDSTISNGYHFQFPITVLVSFNTGPLQGAVQWDGEQNGAQTVTLKSAADKAEFDLGVNGKCQEINRDDGSCVDYVSVQVLNAGETGKPRAKKRFYVRVMPTK